MNLELIERRAGELHKQLGGKIFAFPIDEADPFSKYATAVYTGEGYSVFPEPLDISEAANAIKATLEGFKGEGWDADYERNVRFISCEAQINAPDVTMRRLRKDLSTHKVMETKKDFIPTEDGYNITARGLIKFSYFEMVDEKNPKAIQFMDEYYKLLAMRKYGKTAAAIKQEVRRMGKDEASKWIEESFKKYIRDDMEVINIMNSLKEKSPIPDQEN